MPANALATIAIEVDVVAAAHYAFSRQDDAAFVSQIPDGGTTLVLPAGASSGDNFGFYDADGSCSASRPLVLVAQDGRPVQGSAAGVALSAPFSWGRAVFDEATASWALQSSAAAPARVAAPTALAVDPIGGNDSAPAGPFRSIARLNAFLRGATIAAPLTVTLTADVPASDELLDLSGIAGVAPGGSLTIRGTPQVLPLPAGAGTLTSGTIAMNASANQRQVVEDTALGPNGFQPFERFRLVDTAPNGNSGTGVWIASPVSGTAQANASAPATPSGTRGTLAAGDSYRIARGSLVGLGTLAVNVEAALGASVVTFVDLTFATNASGACGAIDDARGAFVFVRCRFDVTPLLTGTGLPLFEDCLLGGVGGSAYGQGFLMCAQGALLTSGQESASLLVLSGDTYVTGSGTAVHAENTENLLVLAGVGSGAQWQDCQGPAGILVEASSQTLGGGPLLGPGLLWGSGQSNFGLAVGAASNVVVSGRAAFAPLVTGAQGDFAFETPTGGFTNTALPFDQVARTYSPQVACTWANFTGPAFELNAHWPPSGSSLVGV